MSNKHRANLLENSISFFQESIRHFKLAVNDPIHWKFAIVNLVQSFELSIKESLRREHEYLLYENVDNPKRTVSVKAGIGRLLNIHPNSTLLNKSQVKVIYSAIEWRNRLIHYEFEYDSTYLETKFASLYAISIFFFQRHLEVELSKFIDHEEYKKIYALDKTRKALVKQAEEYISNNDDHEVWVCLGCEESAFIVEEGRCILCHYELKVVDCPNCNERIYDGIYKTVK